ncbi:MAG: FkbM family methyltransferase, partial [Bacteroidales bacterium]|nr:FkbM family methyltransferase [Bacteroidales bacterium]
MKSVRKLLLKILGLKSYLSILSVVYLFLVKKGLLKKKYPELFYLEKIIKQGDTCIDIGANLAYYSWFMSKHCGATGSLIAIEPVPLFAEIWRKNMKSARYKNYKLENCALGAENKKVLMQTPEIDGVLHHGMTHIVDNNSQKQKHSYEVDMKVPDEIFANLKKLNFVKIDVEGYEHLVLENMQETIQKFQPIIQAELSG